MTARKLAPKWDLPPSLTETQPPELPKETAQKSWKMINLATVKPETVQWLWYPYIPLGRLTSIEGDPGVGKSWLTAALAAHVSTGRPLPGAGSGPPGPGNVLMMSGEDGLADTIVPRLLSMGADMHRIGVPAERVVINQKSFKGLEELVTVWKPSLLTIDPVQLYMGGDKDMNKANEVREFLGALHNLGERHRVAIIIVRHMRKAGAEGSNLYKGLGSIDFIAAVRSTMQITPGDIDPNIRFLSHEKHNLSPGGPGISYFLENSTFRWGEFQTMQPAAPAGRVNGVPKVVAQAQALLKELLSGGPIPAKMGTERMTDGGFSASAIDRARKGFVKAFKRGDEWFWELSNGE